VSYTGVGSAFKQGSSATDIYAVAIANQDHLKWSYSTSGSLAPNNANVIFDTGGDTTFYTAPIQVNEWTVQPNYTVFEAAPDSKVEIPTSELRMQGNTSRGTGAEAYTLKYNNVLKVRGDGITYDNSNGTVITVQKDGLLHIVANGAPSPAAALLITLNASDPSTLPTDSERLATHTASTSSIEVEVSASLFVKAGDKIRVACAGIASFGAANLLVTHQEQRVQVAVSNIEPQYEDADSMVRLQTGNGHGSTNTHIRRFSNLLTNTGDAVTYTDSATDGASFRINETGMYHITYQDSKSTSAANFGITRNCSGSDLTTDIVTLSDPTKVLANGTIPAANVEDLASWSGILNEGDIIRAHTDSSPNGGNIPNMTAFTISKIGKPSIAEVDVTPFVDLNKEKLIEQTVKYQEYLGYGSTNTFIPYFNRLEESNGSGLFSITNDSVSGFLVTAIKDCTITMTVNGYSSGQQFVAITKNSTELSTSVSALTDTSTIVSFDTNM
jgi:hypothetical protein